MQSYFVYILRSDKGRHYIGYTSNLSQRLSQHNRKHKGFTGTKNESWELLHSLELIDKISAIELEKHLKSFKNSSKAIDYLTRLLVQSTPTKSEGSVVRTHQPHNESRSSNRITAFSFYITVISSII
jgi:putative endonuclease